MVPAGLSRDQVERPVAERQAFGPVSLNELSIGECLMTRPQGIAAHVDANDLHAGADRVEQHTFATPHVEDPGRGQHPGPTKDPSQTGALDDAGQPVVGRSMCPVHPVVPGCAADLGLAHGSGLLLEDAIRTSW